MRGAVPCSFSSFSVIGLCGWNFVIGFYFFSFVLFFLFSFFGVSDICRLCVGPMSDTPFCSDHPPLFFVFFSFFSISFGVSDICPTFVGHLSDAPFVFLYRLVLFSGRAFSSRPGLLWVASICTSLFFFAVVVSLFLFSFFSSLFCFFCSSVSVSSFISLPSNSRGTIFVMSLLRVPLFPGPVHTSTVLAWVSSPCTAVILPSFQASRCLTSS